MYAIQAAGDTVFAGGSFTAVGGQPRSKLAAIAATTGTVRDWDPGANATVKALAVAGQTLFIGGVFTQIAGQARNFIAALDATTGAATPWDPGADAGVEALAISGQSLYAGGWFGNIGGQPRRSAAQLDLTSGQATAWNPSPDRSVRSLSFTGDVVYLAGDFRLVGGLSRSGVAAVDADFGAATAWSPVDDMSLSGSTLYVSGVFGNIGGQARNGMAAIDTGTGDVTPWNPAPDGYVYAVAAAGDTIYVGGRFSQIGGAARSRVAAVDATTGSATAFDPGADGWVGDISVRARTSTPRADSGPSAARHAPASPSSTRDRERDGLGRRAAGVRRLRTAPRPASPPTVSCAGADGEWHGDNVAIACTATANGSPLANPADASFTLTTTVPAGSHDADASTGSREVCSEDGACVTAGPIGANKIDRKAPTLSPVVNAGDAIYLGATGVTAAPGASDGGGSGIASSACAAISTAAAGAATTTCTATDHAGNMQTATVQYVVEYRFDAFIDPTEAERFRAGEKVRIRVALTDAAGQRIPAAQAKSLAAACRVKASAIGAQTLAPTCMKSTSIFPFEDVWATARNGAKAQ